VQNNQTITVMQALLAANSLSGGSSSSPYDGITSLRNMANNVFDAINQGGDIK